MELYNRIAIDSSGHADVLGPVQHSEIERAEAIVGRKFPSLIRRWIADFGSIQLRPDVEHSPKLLLLGLGEHASIDDNIILFNDNNNPSRPINYLVFAHEFDGESDIVYAITPDESVFSTTNSFAFPFYPDKEAYASAEWKQSHRSIEDFWSDKVLRYLEES